MIDVVHQINATQRQVGSRVLEAGDARTVTISQTYDADVDDVWDACTNPERIPRWFLPVSGDLVVGGRFQLEGNAGGTIQACDPPHGFTATWEFGDTTSWIALRLTAVGEGTRLELEHTLPVDEHWELYGPGAVGVGWDLGITLGLRQHLASGEPVDPAEVAAWTASEDGVRFTRLSAEAWGEADIAGGADEAGARQQAANTIAAYTGTGG
jgi:uncharacterized protein YndB with AHSA1/START domain